MKTINLMTTAILLASLAPISQAKADTAAFLSSARKVQDLQAAGMTDPAYEMALQTMGDIRSEIGVDQIVQTIQDKLTVVQNQVVTGHHSSNESLQGSFSALFGMLSGGGNYDHSLDYDITALIVQNPEEVNAFPSRVAADREALRKNLVSYINAHTEDLTVLKVLAMNAFQLIIQKADQGKSVPASDINQIVRTAEGLNFLGQQQVTTCLQTNYANTEHKESTSAGFILDLFLIKAQASGDKNSDDKTFAHQQTSCSSSVNTVQASDNDLVFNVNLTQLDRAVRDWAKAAIVKTALSGNDDPIFPTWGNPYYQN